MKKDTEGVVLDTNSLKEQFWTVRLSHYEEARNAKPINARLFSIIGLIVAGLLVVFGYLSDSIFLRVAGYMGIGFGGAMMLMEFLQIGFRHKIVEGLNIFASWVGTLISWICFVPTYFIGFTIVRFLNFCGGRDDLRLKHRASRSEWLGGQTLGRQSKCVEKMFLAESTEGKLRYPIRRLAVLVVGFVLLSELVLRFFGFHDPLLYRNDAVMGFALQANQSVTYRRGLVKTNNIGVRHDKDFDPSQKPENTFRIMLLGDSTLFGGDLYTLSDLYSAKLEASLKESVPNGNSVEVFNVGVNAWGAQNQLGFVKVHGFLKSDVTIVCVPIGDLIRRHHDLTGGRFLMKKPYCALQTLFMRLTPDILNSVRRMGTPGPGGNPNHDYYNVICEEGIAAYVEIAKKAKAEGVEIWFQIMPQQDTLGQKANLGVLDNPGKDMLQRLQTALNAHQVAVEYPIDLFKGKGEGQPVWMDEAHLGPKGHTIYGEYLDQQVRAKSVKWRTFIGSGAK